MGSPSTLDVDALAAPLAEPDPNAATVFRELSGKFAELVREEREEDFPAGHPGRDNPKKPNWPGVVSLARESLERRVKDLRIACWLTAGLAEVHRFGGLRDGLRLIHRLAEQSWDSLMPAGPSPRARADAVSKFLDDPDAGLAFPGRVRLLPVVQGAKEGYGYLHLRRTSDDGLGVDEQDFAEAVERASYEECQTTAEDIADCLGEVDRIKAVYAERLPEAPLGLVQLSKALEDCQRWAADLVKKKRPPDAVVPNKPPGEAATTSGEQSTGAGVAAVIATREQAYQQLREAARVLGRLEPSSPVPCLIELAVELAEKPFPQMMRALADMQLFAALVRDSEVHERLKQYLSR